MLVQRILFYFSVLVLAVWQLTGTRKVERVRVPETRPKLRMPAGIVKHFYEINIKLYYYNINYFIIISILLNILVLLINMQISILTARPPEKNYRAGLPETRPTFVVKTRNPPEPEKSYPSQL